MNTPRNEAEKELWGRLDEGISGTEPEYRILHFVQKHRRFFSPCPVPERVRIGPRQECFANAQDECESNFDLTYCEGYLLIRKSTGQPTAVRHAWCCTADGMAVDPTHLGDEAIAAAYYGVPFPSPIVRTALNLSERGVVMDVHTIHELERLVAQ